MVRFRPSEGTLAGLFFLGCGVGGLWLCRGLQMGTAGSMGPAFMPVLLAWGMIGLGSIIAIKGLLTAVPLQKWGVRPLLFILGSVLLFATLLPWSGLVLAAFVTVVVSAFASREVRIGELLVLAAGSAVVVTVVFAYVLGMPMNSWPNW